MGTVPCIVTHVSFWPQALLKKHEALMSDLSAYGSSIQALREQAQSCRVSTSVVTGHLGDGAPGNVTGLQLSAVLLTIAGVL